ncbi:cytochrome P450 [Salmonella enterica]|uniref:Cytochrome P450 n=1 Tax=Salmonella enterica TaxID=28901 RepID=A0A505CKD5_SALER|nr:cytochrome P450 [Salmonella enterica]TPQ10747.1 cytochrome P450 [Salmonella enterica]
MKNFMAYGNKFVEEKRQKPGSDIVSLAVTGELPKGLGKLTPLEQLMVFSVVMVAGLETTRNAIAGGILAFIHHPEQWLRLQQDGGLMNSALDEILRWTSPTPYNRRTATRDVIIGDRLIRRGEKVTLWWRQPTGMMLIMSNLLRSILAARKISIWHLGAGDIAVLARSWRGLKCALFCTICWSRCIASVWMAKLIGCAAINIQGFAVCWCGL